MNISLQKTVIIICGPTAVGKTAVAIALAKHFSTEIISADSRQLFKELNIGVARPSEKDLAEIKHHFIASHPIVIGSVHDEMDAAAYEKIALQKASELFEKHDVLIMVGGTGLYIKAFCDGLDAIPNVDMAIREKIKTAYAEKGLGWLQKQVKEKDSEFYKIGEIQNPQRMMRALEVVESTGKSILEFRKSKKATRDFNIIKIGLELPKEELHKNINSRVDDMFERGLVEEAKALLPFKNLNALQTVGYKEIFEYLDGRLTEAEAAEEIKKNTRQYVKRQLTWFKKDKEIKWFSPEQVGEIIEWCKQQKILDD